MEFQASIGPQESLYPAKQFSRTNSLMSIDERSENSLDSKLNNFCRHGYKNGCTASIPSPEEVSEEIFRENWLHKIEILRNRETILREKEINLQKRERKLFRKEKELRITERLLNDKMKQVEQQLKYQKDMVMEKTLEQAAQILYDIEKPNNLVEEKILRKNDVSKKENILKKEQIPKKEEIPKKEVVLRKEEIPKKEEISRQEEIPRKIEKKKKIERITERLLNDKMKQVEQQLKYQKDMVVEKTLEQAAQILYDIEKPNNLVEEKILRKDDVSKKEDILKKEQIPKKEEIPKKEVILRKEEIPKKEEISKQEEIPKKIEIPQKIEILKKAEIPKNLQSIINPYEKKEEKKKHLLRPDSSSRKSFSSKTHSYATIKYKERPTMNYDDLNSSLSAASVDTFNIQTSELFNPMLYKKPHAFTRSVSERWTRHKDIPGKLQRVAEEKPEHTIEEKKIFRKFSDNICALQEKETRFQNYGPIDSIPDDILGKAERNNKDKLSSYLNLETGERYSHRDQASTFKDRPMSWTSETDKWMQKHQMYNSETKSIENKENVVCNIYKAKKKTKKKSKKFPLFR